MLRRWLENKINAKPRVPAGQHIVTSFPILHVGPTPPFDPKTWQLKVMGLVKEEKAYDYEAFTSGTVLPIATVQADFHCVTSWSQLDNTWEGVKFVDVAAQIQAHARATYVMAHCAYGYTTNIPLEDLMHDNVLFAWRHNGKDLTPDHGYPLRLVVPHLYGWKSAKWIHAIEFMAEDTPGYWEQRGYHMYGDPWREQRYAWN
ncbi:MAG: sulfite oxidase-like oxidoreductase [Candidatus Tectomicrobia bacterium]